MSSQNRANKRPGGEHATAHSFSSADNRHQQRIFGRKNLYGVTFDSGAQCRVGTRQRCEDLARSTRRCRPKCKCALMSVVFWYSGIAY
eukprot:485394-Pyramimonas_sp.AAC.2